MSLLAIRITLSCITNLVIRVRELIRLGFSMRPHLLKIKITDPKTEGDERKGLYWQLHGIDYFR